MHRLTPDAALEHRLAERLRILKQRVHTEVTEARGKGRSDQRDSDREDSNHHATSTSPASSSSQSRQPQGEIQSSSFSSSSELKKRQTRSELLGSRDAATAVEDKLRRDRAVQVCGLNGI